MKYGYALTAFLALGLTVTAQAAPASMMVSSSIEVFTTKEVKEIKEVKVSPTAVLDIPTAGNNAMAVMLRDAKELCKMKGKTTHLCHQVQMKSIFSSVKRKYDNFMD